MSPVCHVAVVIPARDEAETIEQTIDAVEHARRQLPPDVTSECVVVVDASSDGTGEVVECRRFPTPTNRRTSSSIVVVRTAHGRVGAARHAGCHVALTGSPCAPRRVWLANTDADTLVPAHWLTVQLDLAASGATALAGTVELDAAVDWSLRDKFAAAYRVPTDGTHRHVHGANMGVRGDVYLRAGGWPRLDSGEDHDLWARLGRVTTCVSSTAITVRTSARLDGRAPGGFARDLVRLAEAGGGCDDRNSGEEVTVA